MNLAKIKFYLNKLIYISFILAFFSINISFADVFEDGINAYNQGDFLLAESYFKESVKLNPNDSSMRYYLAITYVKNKKNIDAKREYLAIINNAPDTEAAYKSIQGLELLNKSAKMKKSRVELNISSQNSPLIVKNVKVNDKVFANFILDTGSTYTSITPLLAKKLGLLSPNLPKVYIITANGTVKVPKILLNSIEIDGLTAKNVEVIVLDIGAKKEISGLLGLSYIQKFKITIDKQKGKLILEKL